MAEKGGISWIASYPKSGNTWLRLFLAAYRNRGGHVHPNCLPRDLDVSDTQPEHYYAVCPCRFDVLTPSDVLFLRGAVLFKIFQEATRPPVMVKTHHARVAVDGQVLIPDLLTGKSVYIVRDPRDVCVSFAEWSEFSIDDTINTMELLNAGVKTKFADNIIHLLTTWSMHVDSWARSKDTLVIRYEDMIDAPYETFGAVIRHLGIPFDQSILEKAVWVTSFATMQADERVERFLETPPHLDRFFVRGKWGGWREKLTPEQTARIEAAHGKMMERFGYTGDGYVSHADRAGGAGHRQDGPADEGASPASSAA